MLARCGSPAASGTGRIERHYTVIDPRTALRDVDLGAPGGLWYDAPVATPPAGGVLSAPDPRRLACGSGAIPRKGGCPVRNYEIAYIVDPDLDENSLTALEEKVKGWIEAAGGSVAKVDRWGKRRLAYTIKKRHDGHYVFVQAAMPTTAGAELERNLRLTEQVMRFMITLQEAA